MVSWGLQRQSARFDLGPKRQTYFRSRVEELWIVDPQGRTVAVYRQGGNEESPVATLRSRELLTSPLLPGFELEIAAVISDL